MIARPEGELLFQFHDSQYSASVHGVPRGIPFCMGDFGAQYSSAIAARGLFEICCSDLTLERVSQMLCEIRACLIEAIQKVTLAVHSSGAHMGIWHVPLWCLIVCGKIGSFSSSSHDCHVPVAVLSEPLPVCINSTMRIWPKTSSFGGKLRNWKCPMRLRAVYATPGRKPKMLCLSKACTGGRGRPLPVCNMAESTVAFICLNVVKGLPITINTKACRLSIEVRR